jgi:uncharacterized protein (DUF362 family)/Pyruvate/2-oxoacid:ferredoxin oxidoreductase delta subunit
MPAEVALLKCRDYTPRLVEEAVRKSISLLGNLKDFIRPQSKVLLKPNLLMARQPEFGITTHPEVVRAVARILKEYGCQVILGDGPSVWGNQIERIAEVHERTGMKKVCQEEAIELVNFERFRWRGKFPLSSWLDECDYLVSIPKLKTHDLTILTGAIKNLFGLVSGPYKTVLHKKYWQRLDFCKALVDIYEEARPALTVVDAITAMEGDGPASAGKLRHLGAIVSGRDAVAVDSILACLMGLRPQDVLSTKEAELRKLGEADLDSISVLGDKLEDVVDKPFLLPTTTIDKKIPLPLVKFARNFIRFYPRVLHDNCTKCGACIVACPEKIMRLRANRIVIDYRRCIACFCCQEACAFSAVRVKKTILARLIGL